VGRRHLKVSEAEVCEVTVDTGEEGTECNQV
jgi:hypothetical protein